MKILKLISLIFLSVGICMLSVSAFMTYSTYWFIITAEITTGQIIGTKNWYPIFRFSDSHWNINEKISSVSLSQNIQIGEDISVIYSEENWWNAIIHSFFYLYLPSLILWFLGCVFSILWYSIYYVLTKDRRNEKKSLSYSRIIQATHIWLISAPISLNGKSLLRLKVQWQDPNTQKRHIFYSKIFEYDPTPYIQDTIFIKIDGNNYKKYWVDTSSFPELA